MRYVRTGYAGLTKRGALGQASEREAPVDLYVHKSGRGMGLGGVGRDERRKKVDQGSRL